MDDYVEHIQKRIRNLQKRKSKLEGYEQLRQQDPARLNADQVAALANKDSVDAPLKELQDALKLYTQAVEAREARFEQEKQAAAAAAAAVGVAAGKETLLLFSQFLRTAALKHQVHDTPAAELAAVDELLQLLYLGDDSSLEAISKLSAKSDEVVHGEFTFAQLHELTQPKSEEPKETKQVEEAQPVAISFLQEDELAEAEPKVEAAQGQLIEAEQAEQAQEQVILNAPEPSAIPAVPAQPPKEKDDKRRKPRSGRKPQAKSGKPDGKSEGKKDDEGWETQQRRAPQKKPARGPRDGIRDGNRERKPREPREPREKST